MEENLTEMMSNYSSQHWAINPSNGSCDVNCWGIYWYLAIMWIVVIALIVYYYNRKRIAAEDIEEEGGEEDA
jgi:hypothetical protein